MSTSTSTGSSTTNLYLDKNIMEVFEEKEDIFSFPLTTTKQARDFVKILDRRGCPYDVLCRELHENEENFRDWRLGGDKPDIGKHVIDRINKPFQETMFSVSEKDDKDPRNYTFKDFYQQFSVDEEIKTGKKSSDVAVKGSNTNSAVINGRKAESVKLPSILVKEPSISKSPESGVDAKQLNSTPKKLSSTSLSPSSASLSPSSSSTSFSPSLSNLSASTSQLSHIKDPITVNMNKSQSSDSVSNTKTQETKCSDTKMTRQQKRTTTASANTSREASTKLDSDAAPPSSASTTTKSLSVENNSPKTSSVAARKTSAPSSPTTATSSPSKPSTPTSSATTRTTQPSTTSAALSTATVTTTTTSTPAPSTSTTAAKSEPTSNESEEVERPPSPITTSPHYQPFVHNFSTDELLPMINYNSDDDDAATSTTDEPGYIYLLSDIPSGNLTISKYTKFRVRISCSKFPEKRLRQAILFNPDIKMIGSIKVPLMKKSLNDARQKLKSFILKNKVDWYWGTLNGIFGAVESAL